MSFSAVSVLLETHFQSYTNQTKLVLKPCFFSFFFFNIGFSFLIITGSYLHISISSQNCLFLRSSFIFRRWYSLCLPSTNRPQGNVVLKWLNRVLSCPSRGCKRRLVSSSFWLSLEKSSVAFMNAIRCVTMNLTFSWLFIKRYMVLTPVIFICENAPA